MYLRNYQLVIARISVVASVLFAFFSAASTSASESERIYSALEISKEDALWREVRPDRDIESNIKALKERGFTDGEIETIRGRLEAIWLIELDRDFGWMDEDVVKKVRAIDSKYVSRIRAARMREISGLELPIFPHETPRQTEAKWRGELLRVLDYDDFAEFRLMNSPAARRMTSWSQGLPLTVGEIRTLNLWIRDFESIHGPFLPDDNPQVRNTALGRSRIYKKERLELWSEIRGLLGDNKCAALLDRVDTAFRRMNDILCQVTSMTTTSILNVWWVRMRNEPAIAAEFLGSKRNMIVARSKDEVRSLIGDIALETYLMDKDANWLTRRY